MIGYEVEDKMKFDFKAPKKKKKGLNFKAYYLNKQEVDSVVLGQVRKNKSVVYGARALNYRMPSYLKKHTVDYDIYSKKPEKAARELEKRLDKKFGGDYFRVEKAQHPRTWKVKSNVTEKTVVDYTVPPGRSSYDSSMDGVNYMKLQQIKRKLQKILRQKDKEFRHKKDREALRRIKVYEEERW